MQAERGVIGFIPYNNISSKRGRNYSAPFFLMNKAEFMSRDGFATPPLCFRLRDHSGMAALVLIKTFVTATCIFMVSTVQNGPDNT